MTWVWAAVAGIGVAMAVPSVRRWWIRRAWTDPTRDPAAALVGAAVREEVERLLTTPGDPAEQLAAGLRACEVDEQLSWRGGLRRFVGIAERLGAGPDSDALRAELWLALGEVDRASAMCADLPADHWRGCVVRSGLYAIEGDDERADSALVAAGQLAPPGERDAIYRRLHERRLRRGVRVGEPLTLWERPPG